MGVRAAQMDFEGNEREADEMKKVITLLMLSLLLACNGSNGGNGDIPPITCDPPTGWDDTVYLELNPDVAADSYYSQYPLIHWCSIGKAEGRKYKKITSFTLIEEAPLSCYFTVKKINGVLNAGTYGYQNGIHASEIRQGKTTIQKFDAESVFAIREFKGDYYASLEHGKFSTVDRAMIYKLINGVWQEVYRHPRWVIMTEMHVHEGYLYATGTAWDNPSDPAGVVRSSDGINWEIYFENSYEYRFWGMTSMGSELWIAATSSGVDWGSNNSNPSVFRGKDLIWRDYSRPNHGFWGITHHKGDIYLGGTGIARVVRFSDKRTVLESTAHEACHWIGSDGDNMFAAFSSSGAADAKIYKSIDGTTWTEMTGITAKTLISGSFEDDGLYIAGGRFHQKSEGYGHIYKSN